MCKNNQVGRSMVEMLGVLAIIGVLSVGGIAAYSKAMEKYNFNKLRDQFFQIVHNITTAASSGHNVTQLANNNVIDTLNILPQEMGKAADCRHALGGGCLLTGGGDGTIFTVRFKDLETKPCAELATLDLTSYNVKVVINATNNYTVDSSTCTTEDGESTCSSSKVRTVPQAIKECRGKKNAVTFIFQSL